MIIIHMKKFLHYRYDNGLRARAILLVLEKFTCAYLFQIAREKSCDYLYRLSQSTLTEQRVQFPKKLQCQLLVGR